MSDLTPEAKQEVREFLRKERQSTYILGGISLGTIVVVLGGLLSFMWSMISANAVTEAQNAARDEINDAAHIQTLQSGAFESISQAQEEIGIAKGATTEHLESAKAALIKIQSTLAKIEGIEGTVQRLRSLSGEIDQIASELVKNDEFSRAFKVEIAKNKFPANSVLIVDDPKGCPEGWTDLGQAEAAMFAGRIPVIAGVAAGRDSRKFREVGGAERVALTEDHIKAHHHAILGSGAPAGRSPRKGETVAYAANRGQTGIPDPNYQYQLVASAGSPNIGATSSYGKSRSFSIMPPHIALYFCKKD